MRIIDFAVKRYALRVMMPSQLGLSAGCHKPIASVYHRVTVHITNTWFSSLYIYLYVEIFGGWRPGGERGQSG